MTNSPRGNRIKTLIYPYDFVNSGGVERTGVFNAATVETAYSKQTINGEILDVEWNFNRTGSISLRMSGTSIEFFRRNLPSGTAWGHGKPAKFGETTTGSIAGAEQQYFNAHDKIIIEAGSVPSGTQALNTIIKYR